MFANLSRKSWRQGISSIKSAVKFGEIAFSVSINSVSVYIVNIETLEIIGYLEGKTNHLKIKNGYVKINWGMVRGSQTGQNFAMLMCRILVFLSILAV